MYFYKNTYAEHHSGTAQGGAASTITLATEANSSTINYYNGWEIQITNNDPQGSQGVTKEVQSLERTRRNSISDLKEKMWQKLLDAEEESAEIITKYKKENDKLKKNIIEIKKELQFCTISKLNMQTISDS